MENFLGAKVGFCSVTPVCLLIKGLCCAATRLQLFWRSSRAQRRAPFPAAPLLPVCSSSVLLCCGEVATSFVGRRRCNAHPSGVEPRPVGQGGLRVDSVVWAAWTVWLARGGLAWAALPWAGGLPVVAGGLPVVAEVGTCIRTPSLLPVVAEVGPALIGQGDCDYLVVVGSVQASRCSCRCRHLSFNLFRCLCCAGGQGDCGLHHGGVHRPVRAQARTRLNASLPPPPERPGTPPRDFMCQPAAARGGAGPGCKGAMCCCFHSAAVACAALRPVVICSLLLP